MPKDATKNIDRYKIRGGQLNEFEYAENQRAVAERKPTSGGKLIPGTPPEEAVEGLQPTVKARRSNATKGTKSTKATKVTKAPKVTKATKPTKATKARQAAKSTQKSKVSSTRGASAKKLAARKAAAKK